MKTKTLVILGHPDRHAFCGALARAYVDGAVGAGAEVRQLDLGELAFDPVMWNGYGSTQALEPDLERAQDWIQWADHLVFVYPNWWGSMPALMKGFFDRVFLPGFAFRYGKGTSLPEKLLAGRTAQLIVCMDTPSWYNRWILRRPGLNQMKRTVLAFCGIKVVRATEFAPVRGASPAQREKWIATARALGENV